MMADLRFAVRMIVVRPLFSLAVIVTLALGIGINTTVFTMVSAALLRPLPGPRGDRLVVVQARGVKDPDRGNGISLAEYLDIKGAVRAFASLEACDTTQATLTGDGVPASRYEGAAVSAGLFDSLLVRPSAGRGFSPQDCQKGAPNVALIGYELWQKRYAGALSALGSTIRVNGQPTTIVGVMPPDFRFPSTQVVWMALKPGPAAQDRNARGLRLFGILADGADLRAAQAQLDVLSARLSKAYPASNADWAERVLTLQEAFNGGPIKRIFLILFGAGVFVLLIACANVANLMLGRAQSRSREVAIRAAVGASRWQILRQLLVESVLLSVLGGIAGWWVARTALELLSGSVVDVGKPYWVRFEMDWRAFAYLAAASVGTGVLFGIVPALRAARTDVNAAIKDTAAGSTVRGGRLTAVLVVLQFCLTAVLLFGACALIRSYVAAERMNPFVPSEHLLTARIQLPDGAGERYEGVEARRRMHDLLLARLQALPGVSQVALASDMPGMGSQVREIEVEGRPNPDPKNPPRGAAVFATPGYLSVIGMPLLSGRPFAATDGLEGREASVVTRAFAEKFWPGQDALGRRFRFVPEGKPGPWITVVGVCGDVLQDTFQANPPPLAYFSDKQEPWAWLGILVRASGDPGSLASSVRTAVQNVDAELPVMELRTLPAAIAHDHWFLRVFGSLLLAFAGVGLTLACVGVYGVVAQATAMRTREIGIRIALGASTSRVIRLVLSRGVRQMAVGLALGLACTLGVARVFSGLPGVASGGFLGLQAAILGVLGMVGVAACWLPARRAARIAPTEALRTD